ncbi:fumarylacetoacetate hydrolase family protein [Leptospira langatensis]|uniref:Fumarylacetoacetate hydrolase family protein n=1 Tax=Leptospira langatensis TaxID=2484983 RepID=A0A5F1ZWP1_9LEPT|nr:fumarylacetoacetate hydrolase family protein [Leptospira langatensis]TGJ98371.1 fumarylacetoacetate hydrolase family protein [Leptospira langatensis]TGL43285.1 fumarylacetoacetate hydrolase family protein [Leptospira langatensis]
MAKNYIRFQDKGKVDWGFYKDGSVTPLGFGEISTQEFLEAIQKDPNIKTEKKVSLDGLSILSPITAPCQIVCQGANYRQHLIESGLNPDDKTYNMFFTKSDASLTSPVGNVIRPKHVKLLDYEIELGLVFGKKIDSDSKVTLENAPQFVAAFFMANDVSARDVQLPQLQWYKGKSYRTFLPAGPMLAVLEPGDFSLLENLELTLLVNDEIRQHDTASNLVFKPAETIVELSKFCNITPGDVLITGTPSGCALRAPGKLIQKIAALLSEKKKWELFVKGQLKRKEYLQPKDRIRSSIRTADRRVDLGDQILTVIEEA